MIEHLGVDACTAIKTKRVPFTKTWVGNSESRCVVERDGGFELAYVTGPHFSGAVGGANATDNVVAAIHLAPRSEPAHDGVVHHAYGRAQQHAP